jgi:GT2 family glycosyltransferase
MNVSILIPTRHRVAGLFRAINSVLSTVDKPNDVEFIVRISDDDHDTLMMRKELDGLGNVHTVYGKNLGFAGDPEYLWQMSQKAQGDWLWGFNDDLVVEYASKGWDTSLMEQPKSGVVVVPYYNVEGRCRNGKDPSNPFVILPNRWWLSVGITKFEHPTDAFCRRVVEKEAGWKRFYLSRLATFHDRRSDRLRQEEGR